ncbi:MAG: hypothetical protein EOR46_33885 [Mesorhizobium sp.]|nr:MAG: hypothetical protein EOR46_33885 [Mesorhizobium sp.]RWK68477.1 MAG: hypothetical protein EOR50_35315 [Mesorhizobium sp.]RWK74749.1 MAG: hypothetical protein EOR51_33320 [Mesorhizobium sp.]RWK99700.1 MAG: hypothetical protein EOR55_31660 [Mesorhizobium sp.]RWL00715.1 MAG: hypothetical protein EOR56_34465 [Mesorhizobium sp.]
MVRGRRLSSRAGWWRGLVRLVPVVAMAMAAFAAKAEDVFPKWSDLTTWTEPKIWSDDHSPMRFAVVRSSATGCEPNCPERISAEGAIEAGTPAQLKRMLKKLGRRKLPIIVSSPGGNVDAALQLGRIVRKNKLDIAVGTTMFSDCWPGMKDCRANDGKGAAYFGIASDSGAMCNSACPLMFAGGVRRVVGGWAHLGVHQITTTHFRTTRQYRTTYRVVRGKKYKDTTETVTQDNIGYKTYEMSKAFEKRLSAYLREMGVGRGVLDVMKATPASDIRQIALDDMLTMKLVTSRDSLDILTQAGICRRSPAPPNCREVPANAKPAKTAVVAVRGAVPATPSARPAPVDNSMRFVLVRSSDPKCGLDCPEWIAAQGTITPDTQNIFRQLLDTVGGRRLPLIVSSPGGDLLSALAMGRLIRDRKLDVAIARTDFTGCKPQDKGCAPPDGFYPGVATDSGAGCDAACPIMLAGGVRRFVGPDAVVSVQPLAFAERVRSYLAEMSVRQHLFPPVQFDFADFRLLRLRLEPGTMLTMGLTTGPESANHLVGPTVCKTEPRPQNCPAVSALKVDAQFTPKP